MKLFTSPAVVLLLSGGPAVRAKIPTCSDQAKCIYFTINENPSNSLACFDELCPDSEICMIVDYSQGCEGKSGAETISHTCERDDAACYDDTEVCTFKFETEVKNIGDGYTSCQNVFPGAYAHFLLKDADNCGMPGEEAIEYTVADGNKAFCGPTGIDNDEPCSNKKNPTEKNPGADSCTGNGPGKECVWTVMAPIPQGCTVGPPPTTTLKPCVGEECCDPVNNNCDPEGCNECCETEGSVPVCCGSGPCVDDEICLGYTCPDWVCKTVCEQITTPLVCTDTSASAQGRRSLQEAANAGPVSWLRSV